MGHFLVPSSTSEGVVDALRSLADKLNEIIDHLNSQAQPEEMTEDRIERARKKREEYLKRFEDTPEEKEELTKEEWFMLKLAVNEIHNKGNGAYDEIGRKIDRLSKLKGKEWNKTALETYKQATQDTTEEWVEGLRKLMSTWGKVLYVNKGRIGKGMQTDMYTRFYKFVKQLLDDREREAYHDGYTDGVTRCMDSLNKLEEDKNEGA